MAFENWDKNGSKPNGEQEEQAEKSFQEMTDEELLDSMKSENWGQYDEDKKIECVQEMENRNAAAQGREPATVVSLNSTQYAGQYNPGTNEIYVNVNAMSSYEVLDTYVHESNHAMQYEAIYNGEGYDEHTRTMLAAEFTPGNYTEKDNLYDVQCSEMDSNNKAADFLVNQRERFQDDPEYKAYIQERNRHFEKINEYMENNPEARREMQNQQLFQSFMDGKITREEYVKALQNVNNENFKDSTVEDRMGVSERIAALNAQLNPNVENAAENKAGEETGVNEGLAGETGAAADPGTGPAAGTGSETGSPAGGTENGGGAGDDGGASNDGGLE